MPTITCVEDPSITYTSPPLPPVKKKTGLWIAFGENDQYEAQYSNGELLNGKGQPYEGEGVRIKNDGTIKPTNLFLKLAVNALNKIALAEQEIGTDVIKTLQKSEFKVVIVKKNYSQFDPRGREKIGIRVNEASYIQGINNGKGQIKDTKPSNIKGSGGALYWNPLSAPLIYSSKAKKPIPPNKFIVLAHELFHAYDSSTGNLVFDRYKGTGVKEIRAAYFGNRLRATQIFKIKYYRTPYNTKGYRLLDKDGNPRTVSPTILWDKKDK